MKWFGAFFEKYKGARRLSLLWAIVLITFVINRITQPEILKSLTAQHVALATLIVGILATVVGFYHKSRAEQDKDDQE